MGRSDRADCLRTRRGTLASGMSAIWAVRRHCPWGLAHAFGAASGIGLVVAWGFSGRRRQWKEGAVGQCFAHQQATVRGFVRHRFGFVRYYEQAHWPCSVCRTGGWQLTVGWDTSRATTLCLDPCLTLCPDLCLGMVLGGAKIGGIGPCFQAGFGPKKGPMEEQGGPPAGRFQARKCRPDEGEIERSLASSLSR